MTAGGATDPLLLDFNQATAFACRQLFVAFLVSDVRQSSQALYVRCPSSGRRAWHVPGEPKGMVANSRTPHVGHSRVDET